MFSNPFSPADLFRKGPEKPTQFLLSGALRSIATISVAMFTSPGENASAGLGYYIFSRLNNYDFLEAISGWLITTFICLVIDLAAGILQSFFGRYILQNERQHKLVQLKA